MNIFELFDNKEKCIKYLTSKNITYNKILCLSHNSEIKLANEKSKSY